MKIIENIKDLRQNLNSYYKTEKKIGLIPTMGFLHEGHLSLVKSACAENDIVVVSIFVNPTQFGPQEDYDSYPKDIAGDAEKLKNLDVDYLFFPQVDEMYPQNYSTFVEVKGLTDKLCGSSRPGHFRGVTTVVSKLFNIVQPDRAYFGQKDYQQFLVIKRLIQDLNIAIKLRMVPIVREKDGLALYKALKKGKELIINGEKNASNVKKEMRNLIKNETLAKIDYLEVVDPDNLKIVNEIKNKVLLVLAVYIGETRLIDNFLVTL